MTATFMVEPINGVSAIRISMAKIFAQDALTIIRVPTQPNQYPKDQPFTKDLQIKYKSFPTKTKTLHQSSLMILVASVAVIVDHHLQDTQPLIHLITAKTNTENKCSLKFTITKTRRPSITYRKDPFSSSLSTTSEQTFMCCVISTAVARAR